MYSPVIYATDMFKKFLMTSDLSGLFFNTFQLFYDDKESMEMKS